MTLEELLQQAIQFHEAGQFKEAETLYNRVLKAHPLVAQAWHLMGVMAHQHENHSQALELIARAIAMEPGVALYHYNQGVVAQQLGQCDLAQASYHRALELNPQMVAACNNLGNVLKEQGAYGAACNWFRRATELEPQQPRYHLSVGIGLKLIGDVDGALASLSRALELNPGDAYTHSQWLFTSQYRPGVHLEELAGCHRTWNEQHASSLAAEVNWSGVNREPDRKLRIGFLSPDLGNHPVGVILTPLLERLDRKQLEACCYSDRSRADEYTARLRAAAQSWQQVKGAPDTAVLDQIRKDEIDILFDLAGHTDNHRLLVFARRAAPIQITWAGYVGTTGVVEMDYLLCDRFHAPGNVERYYTEKLLRMPNSYIGYEPPPYAPEVGPLPMLEAGYATFGGFHNPIKITRQVIDLWSELLQALPTAKLLLKYKGMDDPAVQTRIQEGFADNGVDVHRLEFLGQTMHGDHLRQYLRVDISLDTFPYSGGITTCESLWMGTPVITWPQDTFASRHGLSHSENAGFNQGIATDRGHYVKIAREWVQQPHKLAELRTQLRPVMAASPLCDLDTYITDWTSTLRNVWRAWCGR